MKRSETRQIAAFVMVTLFLTTAPAPTSAAPPAGRAAAQGVELPTVGSVAFSYSRAAAVTGCSQREADDVRDLIEGVVHAAPFVRAGSASRFTIQVDVARRAGLVRATFSLFDAAGAARGVSTVDDATCDGAHLKLAASIALLLSPKPIAPPASCPEPAPPACDGPCQEAAVLAARAESRASALREAREKELPRLLAEARRADEERARASFHAVIAAGPMVAFHLAAEPARGLWLSGEARSERWSLLAEVRATFPTRALTLLDGRSTLDLSTLGALLAPCVRWRWLSGCALVEGGGVLVAAALRGATTSRATAPALAGGYVASGLLGFGLRARLDVPIAAGIEARLFADAIAYPIGLTLAGDDPTDPTDPAGPGGAPAAYTFDAPRKISAFVGLGVARSFD